MEFIKKVEIRWSDLDPNFHVRHSVYYDFGAYCRMKFLDENGVTAAVMQELSVGPILFREECSFRREIKFNDEVSISLKLKSISADFRKFTMVHEISINDNEPAARLIIDGAWMSTSLRKIIVPPQIIIDTVDSLDKTKDFAVV